MIQTIDILKLDIYQYNHQDLLEQLMLQKLKKCQVVKEI